MIYILLTGSVGAIFHFKHRVSVLLIYPPSTSWLLDKNMIVRLRKIEKDYF